MKPTAEGLEITREEATDIAEVFSVMTVLGSIHDGSGAMRELTDEEWEEATEFITYSAPRGLAMSIHRESHVLAGEYVGAASRLASLAMHNIPAIKRLLCARPLPMGTEDLDRPELVPAAERALATTAELATIKQFS